MRPVQMATFTSIVYKFTSILLTFILCLVIQIFFPVLYYWGVISGSICVAALSECAIMHSQMQGVLLFHVFTRWFS